MKPLSELPDAAARGVAFVLTDIDDTITTEGRLPAASYAALERLQEAGLKVVPVTGRPGGWCDLIARFWPVEGVVGENGAFYFRYDHAARRMIRRFRASEAERAQNREKLDALAKEILARVPGAALAADQPYRIADLAIDFREDVEPLPPESIDAIVRICEAAGATAKVSSIHVNAWFGEYDKLAMAREMLTSEFSVDTEREPKKILFAGDSMFAAFPLAVGVANIRDAGKRLKHWPAFVTPSRGAEGFVELAERLLAAHTFPG